MMAGALQCAEFSTGHPTHAATMGFSHHAHHAGPTSAGEWANPATYYGSGHMVPHVSTHGHHPQYAQMLDGRRASYPMDPTTGSHAPPVSAVGYAIGPDSTPNHASVISEEHPTHYQALSQPPMNQQLRPTIVTPPPSDGSGPRSPHQEEWIPSELSQMDKESYRAQVHAALSSSSPVHRPDGFRKKNAKFEIPKDRNLDNLDLLISQAKDDGERKEFKMQKRLLRNREAA